MSIDMIRNITLLGVLGFGVACGTPGGKNDDGMGPGDDGGADGGDDGGDDGSDGSDGGDGGDQNARVAGRMASGSAHTAVHVRLVMVNSDGTTETHGEADVEEDGSWELEAPVDAELMLVEAIDASGNLVGAAVVESTGAAGEETFCTPINEESTVEAMAWLELVAWAGSLHEANYADLRSRIDFEAAYEVWMQVQTEGGHMWDEGMEAWGESQTLYNLTLAIATAQTTEIQAMEMQGIDCGCSEAALSEYELMISQEYSAMLYAVVEGGGDLETSEDAAEAEAWFYESLWTELSTRYEASYHQISQVETQASLAWRLALEYQAEASTMAEAIYEQCVIQSAQLEAWIHAMATLELVGEASDNTMEECEDANAALLSSVHSATSIEAMVTAYETYENALLEGSGSVLDTWLDLSSEENVAVDALIDLALDASFAFDSSVRADFMQSIEDNGGMIDPDACAMAVTSSWSSFESSLKASISTLETYTADSAQFSAVSSFVFEASSAFAGKTVITE